MARIEMAEWRPLGGRPEPPLNRKNKLIYHTMVGSLDGTDRYFREINGPGFEGTESHFGTDPTRVYQWQNTNFQADAQLEGNDDCISVETADHGPGYAAWDTTRDNVPAWADEHLELNAQLGAAICLEHNIPPVLIEDTRDATRGIGFHRDGIDPYRDFGERYSTVFAKACPGNRRYAQRHRLVKRIREIMGGRIVAVLDQEDYDGIAKAVWLYQVEHPWTGKPTNMQNNIRYTMARSEGLFWRVKTILESMKAGEVGDVDTDALANRIAEAVADEEAERMAE